MTDAAVTVSALHTLLAVPAAPQPGVAPGARQIILAAQLNDLVGRRQSALDLIEVGLTQYPDHSVLLRLRGAHRMSNRDLAGAVADLERVVEHLVADGDIDTDSSRHPDVCDDPDDVMSAITDHLLGSQAADTSTSTALRRHAARAWQTLGQAQFLLGHHTQAASAFTAALGSSVSAEIELCDWLYLSLRRSGEHDSAAELLDGQRHAAHLAGLSAPLCPSAWRLRLYSGDVQPEELLRADAGDPHLVARLGFGVAAWYQLEGLHGAALRILERVVTIGHPDTFDVHAAASDIERLEREAHNEPSHHSPCVSAHHLQPPAHHP